MEQLECIETVANLELRLVKYPVGVDTLPLHWSDKLAKDDAAEAAMHGCQACKGE